MRRKREIEKGYSERQSKEIDWGGGRWTRGVGNHAPLLEWTYSRKVKQKVGVGFLAPNG